MRTLLLPLLLFISLPTCKAASLTETARLSDANALYENAQFEKAAVMYRTLIEEDPLSPELHYNLGNTYFKMGRPGSLGKAIASYQRAYTLSPRDSDIRYNFDFALRRAGESLVPDGMPEGLHTLFHLLSIIELSAVQWLGFWASLLLGAVYLIQEQRQARLRPWLTGTLLGWIFFAAWWGLQWTSADTRPGVIIRQDAEVRSGPSSSFPVSFKLPEGRRISQLSSKDGWIEIGVRKEGLKGWIAVDALEKI